MSEYYFVIEHSNKQRIRIFFFSLITLLILGGAVFAFHTTLLRSAQESETLNALWGVVKTEIGKSTPTGLFYSGFFGASIFVPMPLELLFFRGLKNSNPLLLSFFLMNTGIILAQVINYLIGYKLSKVVLHIVSAKKVYEMRRKLNKWGAYGIFFGNLIPFIPSELITFGLGLAKYNVYRLFTLTILAVALKYAGIIGIYALLF